MSYSPRLSAAARSTASAWAYGDSPSGSRCTIDVRELSGKPNSSNERCSTWTAGLVSEAKPFRSLSVSGSGGSHRTLTSATATQSRTIGQRSRTRAAPTR